MEFIAEQSNIRIDKYLVEKIPDVSRNKLQNAIKNGIVFVNGAEVKKSSLKLKAGDKITFLNEKMPTAETLIKIEPEKMDLNIVYEDDDILVINKPSGLITHPTPNHKKNTLVNGLLYRYPEILNVGENPWRPGIVHRLDKETSGLIIVAKNQKAFEFMKTQFISKQVKKTYVALVEGVPNEKEGEISYDIRPSKYSRLKKVAIKKDEPITKARRTAKTLYKVMEVIRDKFALLEASPLTGRTHQIRVHLAATHHPIVGDFLYGAKKEKARELGLKRMFLHAERLRFVAPSGKNLALEAGLPEELKMALATSH